MPRRLAVLLVLLAAPALAEGRRVPVENRGDLALMELRAAPAGTGDWGPDLLGSALIGPGGRAAVALPEPGDACDWDLRAVFEDGSERVEPLDLCGARTVAVGRR